MKKLSLFLVVLLSFTMLFSLTACNNDDSGETPPVTYPYTVTGMYGGTISKIEVTFGGLTYDQVSEGVRNGTIKVTIDGVLKTPTIYTLTMNKQNISSDVQAEVITKANSKGWNVVYRN